MVIRLRPRRGWHGRSTTTPSYPAAALALAWAQSAALLLAAGTIDRRRCGWLGMDGNTSPTERCADACHVAGAHDYHCPGTSAQHGHRSSCAALDGDGSLGTNHDGSPRDL
jgi:hypothetical protein